MSSAQEGNLVCASQRDMTVNNSLQVAAQTCMCEWASNIHLLKYYSV
jgi:hypothetical protein